MKKQNKPFLGIMFECCRVYARVYRESDEMLYVGRCPKCLNKVTIRVDPKSGSKSRMLKAY